VIKLFRHIRQSLIMENKTGKYLKYALGEIVLVVVGILIALQINNWNDQRKAAAQEQLILKRLEVELSSNIKEVNNQILIAKEVIDNLKFCMDVLRNKQESTLSEFRKRFQPSMTYISIELSTTTFNRISQSGKIDIIKNTELVDSINAFYNSPYKSWDSANKDYTRTIIAPYLMKYDYVPNQDYNSSFSLYYFDDSDFSQMNSSEYEVKPKSLEDYKQNVFIINLLYQKLIISEGQLKHYESMRGKMESLNASIRGEIK